MTLTTKIKKSSYNPSSPPFASFPFLKSRFLFLSMAASLFFLSFLLFLSSSADLHVSAIHKLKPNPRLPSPTVKRHDQAPISRSEIQQACKGTRFPGPCESSLAQPNRVPPNPSALQIIQSAVGVSTDNLNTAKSMINDILDSSAGNRNRSSAAKICLEVLHNSEYRISLANDSLPRGRTKDARTFMSAALVFQYDCWSALKYVNDTQLINQTMSFLDSLLSLSSNALSMMLAYDTAGNDTASWGPPKTERDGFWEVGGSGDTGSGLSFDGGFPSKMKADVTVCKDGSDGCYKSVQEAVDAAPDNGWARRFVIYIKEGVYEETVRVPLEKRNVVFLGDGMGKTVITGSRNVGQPGTTTYDSATVGVLGDGFMASGLTFQNTAGPDAHQAVAFRSDSDLSVIESCEFLGNQDTLYAHTLRQFYKSCSIEGNVDFIFGNAASIFQDCQILVRPRQLKPEHGENNVITAHGRTDPAQSTGFVFQNCLINGTEEYMALYRSKPQVHKNYLGRPWKEYSRTVFVNSKLEELITLEGWLPWSGDFALKTLFYGEHGNTGLGSDRSKRVSWSSLIPDDHVMSYSVQNFIQGDQWIPSSSSSKDVRREEARGNHKKIHKG